MGILNFSLRKKSLHGKETMPTRKGILGYLLLSMLLCHTTLTGAEEVKIDRTEKIEYEKTAHAVYKELVNPVLVHKNADGSDVHPDKNIVCGHFTRETDLTIGSLNKTLTDLTDNDKKIYDKIQQGEILPKRIAKEFSADLKYFQIDAVQRNEQNRPTIERIRVRKPMKNI